MDEMQEARDEGRVYDFFHACVVLTFLMVAWLTAVDIWGPSETWFASADTVVEQEQIEGLDPDTFRVEEVSQLEHSGGLAATLLSFHGQGRPIGKNQPCEVLATTDDEFMRKYSCVVLRIKDRDIDTYFAFVGEVVDQRANIYVKLVKCDD
jgi:hypothetical protein